jgi:hypothetical protein
MAEVFGSSTLTERGVPTYGTLRSNEEDQPDFQGEEEPTNTHAQHFNREWLEARNEEANARIKDLEARVQDVERYCDELIHMLDARTVRMLRLAEENEGLRKQVESVVARTLQSERTVLVDLQDVD